MNRNGQTLIIFVILLPILLLLAAFVIDIGFITNEKLKMENLLTNVLKENNFSKEEQSFQKELEKIITKNKLQFETIEIKKKESNMQISIKGVLPSIFGNIIGIREYHYQVDKTISSENETWEITKE